MNLIPEAIVEKTWQEFAGFTPNKAKRELMKVSNSQPDLLTFVTESTGEMRGFLLLLFKTESDVLDQKG